MATSRATPRVGVSSCLLGATVRYDGRHKRDEAVVELGRRVELVPVCPEVEAGMGAPREPVRLLRLDGRPHVRGGSTGTDHTEAMARFSARRLDELVAGGLHGYVLKSRSPSCGLDVPLFDDRGAEVGRVAGLFAAALLVRLPGLPIVEEESLRDPPERERFVARVFAFAAAASTA